MTLLVIDGIEFGQAYQTFLIKTLKWKDVSALITSLFTDPIKKNLPTLLRQKHLPTILKE